MYNVQAKVKRPKKGGYGCMEDYQSTMAIHRPQEHQAGRIILRQEVQSLAKTNRGVVLQRIVRCNGAPPPARASRRDMRMGNEPVDY